jgi:hypothetical protein
MPNEIIWEPWADPFQPHEDEIGYRDEEKTAYEEATEERQEHPYKPIAVISSPTLGVVPVMPHAIPSKSFNFWIGHTNFSITEEVAYILEEAMGVETLDIISRYRFRIAIGKAFSSGEVKQNIVKLLCESSSLEENIHNLKSKLSSENKYWFIFVAPNGNMDYAVSEELDEDFKATFKVYEETRDKVNGTLIASWA